MADSSVVDAVVGSRTGLRTPPVPRALVTGLRIPSVPRALLRGVTIPPRRPPVLVAELDSVVRASSLGDELVGWTIGIETPPVPVPAALDSAAGVVAATEVEVDSSAVADVVGVRMGLKTPPVPTRLVTGEMTGASRPESVDVEEASSLVVEVVGCTMGIETPPVPVPAALGVVATGLVSALVSELSEVCSVLVVGWITGLETPPVPT